MLTDSQDLSAQRQRLRELGVTEIGSTSTWTHGTNRARPGLDQALAALREGDTSSFPNSPLARSVPDARAMVTTSQHEASTSSAARSTTH